MKSVGEILKNQRTNRRLTIENVNKAIKVHPKYIKALESDDYSVFDGKIHAKGFLKIYSDFLGLNINELLAIWRREHEADFEKEKGERKYDFSLIKTDKFVLTPKFVLIGISLLALLGFFGYLFYQYKNFNGAPNLLVDSPENNLIVADNIVDITGSTDIDSVIYVNNQKVMINKDGSFATSVNLHEGLNTLSILSVNKLEKKTELIRTVIYRSAEREEIPESAESSASASPDSSAPGNVNID